MSCIRGDKCFPCYSHGSSCVSSFLVMMASHSILTFVNLWNRELWVPPCAVLAWASPCRESQSQFVVAKIPVHKVIQRPPKLAITGLKAEVHLWRDISPLYHAYLRNSFMKGQLLCTIVPTACVYQQKRLHMSWKNRFLASSTQRFMPQWNVPQSCTNILYQCPREQTILSKTALVVRYFRYRACRSRGINGLASMENFHSCVCIMRHLGEIIFNIFVCWSIGRFLHFCSISLRSTSQGAVVARFISYCRFCLLYRPFEGGCWSIPFIQVNKCRRRWSCLLAGVGYGQLRRGESASSRVSFRIIAFHWN